LAHTHDTACDNHAAHALADAADRHCRERGMRLTDLRRQVFDVLAHAPGVMGAYDIIDALARDGGRRLAPISIYRALDFLLEAGLAHKLASRNAFVACPHRHGADDVVTFLICDTCGRVQEATSDAVGSALRQIAAVNAFRPRGQVIEMAGLCAGCAPADGGSALA
jgi:Fur family zinc uptake transcriptional regulator